ncbi:type 1 glutamine amidotransferase [Canibacter oris]|uniref:Lipid II isoglutaminyl synthase (glutamine-hydrolyzing) subunit GatD n=1 Tax=Canibacter oris TaxID=1365628 RepID=A0A840DQY7_9MICO|nr:glutamine amidotransferase [Canibacter oris]MBB4071939.1 hypothetical protein [Canibacter oris]
MVEQRAARNLTIAVLYPREMNMYGDRGNTLALVKRAAAHGYDTTVIAVNPGEELPDADIFLGGGGQDSGQEIVAADLQLKADKLRELAASGVPMLLICGLYQLFGHCFVTAAGKIMEGIGVLDVETRGGDARMIGNIVLESAEFGEIVGYENHSGNTVLGAAAVPFGKVLRGAGNNPTDGVEGARFKNVIGTYLHGSLLPKNPAVSDFLIRVAAERKYGDFVPLARDSKAVTAAREAAKTRPR